MSGATRLGRAAVAGVLMLAGGTLVGERVWLAAKAEVAAVLIDRAFAAHLEDGERHRPWRWADTWPVARLEVPRLGVSRVVLAGATGATLAFGPGHVDGTAPPGTAGNVALAGHRDSWFAFLQDLQPGDQVVLETQSGTERFRVEHVTVTDMHDGTALAPSTAPRLTLITCYPFEGLAALVRGPARYVVTCTKTFDRGWVS